MTESQAGWQMMPCLYGLIVALWHFLASEVFVNIGSGNG